MCNHCKGGAQLIHICVYCQKSICNQRQNPSRAESSEAKSASSQHPSQIIKNIQQNFAHMLQEQLRKLSQRKQEQIRDLEGQIAKFKSQILKLETRNKLDKDNENKLKQQNRILNGKIKELEEIISRKDITKKVEQVVHVIKSKQAPQMTYPDLSPELDNLRNQSVKLKSKIYQLQQTNKLLNNKLQKDIKQYKYIIQGLKNKIANIERQLQDKDKIINQLSSEKLFLSQKIQILNKPSNKSVQPIILHKVISQAPEIRTVYVDRPVEKTKIVEVEKIVKKFIQPQRPIVNKIIQCGKFTQCKCSGQQSSEEKQKIRQNGCSQQQMQYMKDEYEQTIHEYKNERQMLIKTIQNRDSDYRLLQNKFALCNGISLKPSRQSCNQHVVMVTVFKQGQQVNQIDSHKSDTHKSSKNTRRRQEQARISDRQIKKQSKIPKQNKGYGDIYRQPNKIFSSAQNNENNKSPRDLKTNYNNYYMNANNQKQQSPRHINSKVNHNEIYHQIFEKQTHGQQEMDRGKKTNTHANGHYTDKSGEPHTQGHSHHAHAHKQQYHARHVHNIHNSHHHGSSIGRNTKVK